MPCNPLFGKLFVASASCLPLTLTENCCKNMMKNKKILSAIAVAVIVVGGGVWGGREMLYALGNREIYLAAQENGYCHDEACDEGKQVLISMLARETGISADLLPWCMAANAIYTTQVGTLDRLREKFTDWMYKSCGNDDITLEDAVLSLGEPE